MLLLHREKLGQGCRHAQLLGVSSEDATDQRLDDILIGLAAQPSAGEACQALILPGWPNWLMRFATHPPAAAEAQ